MPICFGPGNLYLKPLGNVARIDWNVRIISKCVNWSPNLTRTLMWFQQSHVLYHSSEYQITYCHNLKAALCALIWAAEVLPLGETVQMRTVSLLPSRVHEAPKKKVNSNQILCIHSLEVLCIQGQCPLRPIIPHTPSILPHMVPQIWRP